MSFDIFARDFASKTFDRVGDSSERLGRRLDGIGSASDTMRNKLGAAASGLAALGSRLGSTAGQALSMGASLVASAGQMSLMAGAAGAAASSTLALGAAIAPAAGALTALPGVLAMGAAAMATLKLALVGVGEAFEFAITSSDEIFEGSLTKLAPAAAAVAREFRALRPELQAMQQEAQQSFFAQLAGQFTSVGAALLGPLRTGVQTVGAELGNAAAQLGLFASSAAGVRVVEATFSGLAQTLRGIAPGIRPLLTGLADLAGVGTQFVAGLSGGIGGALTKFGEFLSQAAASGRALEWMNSAVVVFKALGSIAGDVGRIISGIFDATKTAGIPALGLLGQLVDKLSTFVNSAEGQQILVTILTSLHQVGRALGPVVEALARGLATIAPQIAAVATALGPVLAAVISALAPALAALGPGLVAVGDALARAFSSPLVRDGLLSLGTGIAALLAAVAPLLEPLLQLAGILVERLGFSLGLLASLLAPVVSALADTLAPLLPEMAAMMALLAAAVAPVAEQFGGMLGQALRETSVHLGPMLDMLRDAGQNVLVELRAVLPQIVPHLGELARGFGALWVEVVKILPDLMRLSSEILIELIRALPELIPMAKDLALQFLAISRELIPLVPLFMQLAFDVIKPLIPELPKLLPPFVDLVRIFAELMAQAAPLIAEFLKSPEAAAAIKIMVNGAVFALNTLRDTLSFLVGAMEFFVGRLFGLPDRTQAGLGRMADAVKSWLNAVIGWIEGGINSLVGVVPGMGEVRLPRLANGAIIDRQTLAIIGEAGPEVVIPLNRPARAAQLARDSGLLNVLGAQPLGAAAVSSLSGGRGGDLHLHFAGQPLVTRDEISRLLISALATAKARGFNLGKLVTP
ncbi:hypothetical protein [Nonomuraea dietziae]|uniref:hypothetical protein n=1 Tax=Nonomuraea dietziae TaxID=65515 RepID=UPI0034122940